MKDLEWNGEQLERDLRQAAASLLIVAAQEFQKNHKKDLSKSNPPPRHITPSKPGEYPRGRTWTLKDSVTYEPTNKATVAKTQVVRVGYHKNAEYGVYLGEHMRRKWLIDALREHDAAIAAALGKVGGIMGA